MLPDDTPFPPFPLLLPRTGEKGRKHPAEREVSTPARPGPEPEEVATHEAPPAVEDASPRVRPVEAEVREPAAMAPQEESKTTSVEAEAERRLRTDSRVLFAVPTATSPRAVPQDADLGDPRLFFNRELSWLDFNWRVLHEAMDERTPLLERLRFLAITSSNLDEFFRKRVGGLKRQHAAGVTRLSPDGRTPEEQLARILEAARPMADALDELWLNELRPKLEEQAGLRVDHYADLDAAEQSGLDAHFQRHIFPVLTPLAVDPGHPFPFISNLSLSLAVTVRHPRRGTTHFARLKVPISRGRFVPVEGTRTPRVVVPIEEVIAANVQTLFRGMEVVSVHPFRITRNADQRRDEEEADDLLELISEELRQRRFAPVVRLEVDAGMPEAVRELLVHELELEDEDLYETQALLDYEHLHDLIDLAPSKDGLVFESWKPIVPARLLHEGETKEEHDIFSVIRRGDLLLHHPYESFRHSVLHFIEAASMDPQVRAIKLTLYRTSDDSPIVAALTRAVERGKQVAVLVEVKARFDEQNNIEWGKMLEQAGVHVTYGLVGLKTHTKTTLVVREERDGMRAYCHIGTGNYNDKTARLYTDLGLLTCRQDLGLDIVNLFHYLTGYAPEQHYRQLIVAPRDMRRRFEALIDREVQHARQGRPARIMAKMNALDDVGMIRALYRASREGVQIDLVVRGHCRLRPGLEGFGDNIRVVSIVGRFLEHSRIYYFENDGDPDYFLGSADWQRRNLDDRVEAIAPVRDEQLRARLRRILLFALSDQRSAWELQPDGRYGQRQPRSEAEAEGFQQRLQRRAHDRVNEADSPWDITA